MTPREVVDAVMSWTARTPQGGCAVGIVSTEQAIHDAAAYLATETSLQVREVSGKRSQNTKTLFVTWASALGFPDYFGHNWAAFDECISDRELLPRVPTIVFVTNSEDLLSEESPNRREALLRRPALLHRGREVSNYQSLPDFPFPALWIVLFFRSQATTAGFLRGVNIGQGQIDHLATVKS